MLLFLSTCTESYNILLQPLHIWDDYFLEAALESSPSSSFDGTQIGQRVSLWVAEAPKHTRKREGDEHTYCAASHAGVLPFSSANGALQSTLSSWVGMA